VVEAVGEGLPPEGGAARLLVDPEGEVESWRVNGGREGGERVAAAREGAGRGAASVGEAAEDGGAEQETQPLAASGRDAVEGGGLEEKAQAPGASGAGAVEDGGPEPQWVRLPAASSGDRLERGGCGREGLTPARGDGRDGWRMRWAGHRRSAHRCQEGRKVQPGECSW
jgi:hypothetical protein